MYFTQKWQYKNEQGVTTFIWICRQNDRVAKQTYQNLDRCKYQEKSRLTYRDHISTRIARRWCQKSQKQTCLYKIYEFREKNTNFQVYMAHCSLGLPRKGSGLLICMYFCLI